MTDSVWSDLHKDYQSKDWVNKPSLFAETAIRYFPKTGRILELGAGLGQDSRYFAEHGYDVVSTDLETASLEKSLADIVKQKGSKVQIQEVDLHDDLPFDAESFDVVYAHLSLHYFDKETTYKILDRITRILKPGGTLAFFVNSTSDPEYGTGQQLEPDYFKIDQTAKRYFSVASVRDFVWDYFEVQLLDNLGETYKDADKGVHNLVRFIGNKPLALADRYAVPFVGAILERETNGIKEVYLHTRWKPGGDPKYSGTFEFPAGRLDVIYENIYDTLAREIKSESGMTLKAVRGDDRTKVISPQGDDAAFGFRPFCGVQQLKAGKPWVGFIFVCEVEPGEAIKNQPSESKDGHWLPAEEVRQLLKTSPEKFFTLEVPAWEFYFNR